MVLDIKLPTYNKTCVSSVGWLLPLREAEFQPGRGRSHKNNENVYILSYNTQKCNSRVFFEKVQIAKASQERKKARAHLWMPQSLE